jgi:hypothetical protein
VKKQPERPVLITDAARSQDEQFRSRQIRYVTMMGLRAGCLIAGAILISVHPPLLPVWLVICALGMVILPWAAVLIANDRPARSKAERAASAAREQERQQAALAQHSAEEIEYITIDAEPVDVQRVDLQRVDAEPVDAEPAEHEPAGGERVGGKRRASAEPERESWAPAEPKPGGSAPAEPEREGKRR